MTQPSATDSSALAAALPAPSSTLRARLVGAHLRLGWLGLLLFVILGVGLEALHAFKSSLYLGVGHETRRLMWTLAHAHGVGLSLVQLGFAATLGWLHAGASARLALASRALRWSSLLIPLGFFLGGVVTYEGDPGLGVLLVPLGACLLLVALGSVVWVVWAADPDSSLLEE